MLLDPIHTRALFTHALEKGYAILAVNADSPAAVTDCLEAATRTDAPIIIETSLWQLEGRSFGAGDAVLGMARYLAELAVLADSERYRDVPVAFHTDHIKGPETLRILAAGLRGLPIRATAGRLLLSPSSISVDSSDLSDRENIDLICALCAEADRGGVPVTLEMEAGIDAGLTPLEKADELLGPVEERFPARVWLWAPGLGTKHGLTEDDYPSFSAENVRRQRDRARSVTGRNLGLALHGSSGLSETALREGAAAGIVKVNWSSESLLLRSHAAADYYRQASDRLAKTHPDFKGTAMDDGVQRHVAAEYVPRVAARIELLGGAGHGGEFLRTLAVH